MITLVATYSTMVVMISSMVMPAVISDMLLVHLTSTHGQVLSEHPTVHSNTIGVQTGGGQKGVVI